MLKNIFKVFVLYAPTQSHYAPNQIPGYAPAYVNCRLMTYLHSACLCVWLLVNPSLLSYDWSMGSVPLVTSVHDPRVYTTSLLLLGAAVNVSLIYRLKVVTMLKLK